MYNSDIIYEVHETADGFVVYNPTEDKWWGKEGYSWSKSGWVNYKFYRTNYTFKFLAIWKAKSLEEQHNAERRERERRRNFIEKKVWR